MMKKYYKIVMMSLVMIMIGLVGGQVQASELNFGVVPTIPDFQVDKEKTYFDIKVNKGEEQELEVTLKNHTKKAVIVETTFNRATTNVNGIVEYGKGKFKEDSSLIHNIEDIVTVDKPEVKIEPNVDQVVKLKIKAPKEDFPGILASGITFKEKSEDEETEKGQGMAIKNEYAYVIALVMHGNVEQKDIPSELLLNRVEAGQVNVRNVIFANLQNPKAKYLNKLAIEAKIYKKNSDKVVYSNEKEQLQMAPNSNFDYPIHLEGKKLEAGKYTLKLHATSKDDEWNLEKDFTITKEEAKKYNKQDVTIKEDYTWWYVAGGIIALLLLQLIIFLIVSKRKKDKEKKKVKKDRED